MRLRLQNNSKCPSVDACHLPEDCLVSWSGVVSYLCAAHSTFLERALGYVISADVAIFTPVAGEKAANTRRTPAEEKNKRKLHERSVLSR